MQLSLRLKAHESLATAHAASKELPPDNEANSTHMVIEGTFCPTSLCMWRGNCVFGKSPRSKGEEGV